MLTTVGTTAFTTGAKLSRSASQNLCGDQLPSIQFVDCVVMERRLLAARSGHPDGDNIG